MREAERGLIRVFDSQGDNRVKKGRQIKADMPEGADSPLNEWRMTKDRAWFSGQSQHRRNLLGQSQGGNRATRRHLREILEAPSRAYY